MMKMMIVGRRRGGMTIAQLQRYMIEVHGAMVVDFIGKAPDETPQRYIQNHVHDGTFRKPDGSADPLMLNRDFVTQVWFTGPAQAKASMQAPFYREHLQPDEERFVDQPSVVRLPCAAVPLFGAGSVPPGRSKLFVMHRCAPGAAVDAFDAASRAHWQPLLDTGTSIGLQKVVRNRVLTLPGSAAPTVDLVDEVWLHDDAAAVSLGTHWQALIDDSPIATMLVPNSSVLLYAREHVLYVGTPEAVAAAG